MTPIRASVRGLGPLAPTAGSRTALRPVAAQLDGAGLWAERRAATVAAVRAGFDRLEEAGNLHNLRAAARGETEGFIGQFQFQDSDVYKWIEAASWHLGEHDDPELAREVDEAIRLVAEAQLGDGYLQTYYQVARPGHRWTELNSGHELYCHGHLLQAAIAHHRCTGRSELLEVAVRLADHLLETFLDVPPGAGICGHPIIEGALVELYRELGDARYLDLAHTFVERRGHRRLAGGDRGGPSPQDAYWQDHVPIAELDEVCGHAVRQLYLLEGVTDLAVETADVELLARLEAVWDDMVRTRTYVTGGVGARHEFERFGDPYELPADRAYAETCAAIASVRWSWRLALATGRARYSDLIERTLLNGVLAGVSLDGSRYLYVNTLHVRSTHRDHGGDERLHRTSWFDCACCPPNLMRTLTSLQHLVSSADDTGLQIHQYLPGTVRAEVGGSEVALRLETAYPWSGRVSMTVLAGDGHGTLSLRIPGWAEEVQPEGDLSELTVTRGEGWLRLTGPWQPGRQVVLELPLSARFVRADDRIDAVRGCVALERGPLVYCLEDADLPAGSPVLDDVRVDTALEPVVGAEGAGPGGSVPLDVAVAASRREESPSWWPYTTEPPPATEAKRATMTAVPYFAWGNRGDGAMRVWLPRA